MRSITEQYYDVLTETDEQRRHALFDILVGELMKGRLGQEILIRANILNVDESLLNLGREECTRRILELGEVWREQAKVAKKYFPEITRDSLSGALSNPLQLSIYLTIVYEIQKEVEAVYERQHPFLDTHLPA